MRKIVLAISPSKEMGGGQKVFLTLVKELLIKKKEVIVILPDTSLLPYLSSYAIKIYFVNFYSLSCLIDIAKILKKEKVDVINTYLPRCSLLISFVNVLYHIPICCTCLNAIIHVKLNMLQKRMYPLLYFLLYKLCNGIIVNSEQNKRHFIEVGRIKAGAIQVIYSGIETDDLFDIQDSIPKKSRFIIGTIGRLSPEKGQNYLIEALAHLKGIDYECMIVGDGPLRKELEEQVVRENVCARVKFLGFQKRVAHFARHMDVIVVPSLNETFGITIVEAFALKKAVIASDAGGIPELVKHKVTGLLFPAGDSAALAERILYVYHNRAEAEKMAHNAYEFFARNFTSSIMATNTLEYYDYLINQS
ncbi:MAG: glycosyltransferase family 4 protein [bacterium]